MRFGKQTVIALVFDLLLTNCNDYGRLCACKFSSCLLLVHFYNTYPLIDDINDSLQSFALLIGEYHRSCHYCYDFKRIDGVLTADTFKIWRTFFVIILTFR